MPESHSQNLTVLIIFGSIGLLALLFILFLIIKQRIKRNRLKRAKNRSLINQSTSSQLIKKQKPPTSDPLNKLNNEHISLNMENEILEEERLKSKNFGREIVAMKLDDEIYKYLGISLSDIPFIDESTSNTRINTNCQNSCIDLPAEVASSNYFRYQPLT